jgi:K+-sensing histidine kinase KdpD
MGQRHRHRRGDPAAHLRRVLPGPGRPAAVERTRSKGLGLGLAIVKRLADLMGAPLTVRSAPGRGTVFTLELPAGREPRSIAPPSASTRAAWA